MKSFGHKRLVRDKDGNITGTNDMACVLGLIREARKANEQLCSDDLRLALLRFEHAKTVAEHAKRERSAMSDRCQQCGEVPNPDGRCACPRRDAESSFAAPSGSATCRNRPPADLAALLFHWLHNRDRIRAMTNAELVRECLGTEAADWDVVNEMMTRLHPGWENEPDESPNVKVSDGGHKTL